MPPHSHARDSVSLRLNASTIVSFGSYQSRLFVEDEAFPEKYIKGESSVMPRLDREGYRLLPRSPHRLRIVFPAYFQAVKPRTNLSEPAASRSKGAQCV